MKNAGDKILNYLQGILSDEEEKELFAAMAYDDDLRADFRSFAAIDKTLKSTAASFSVPGDVTENIMKGTGLAVQSAGNSAGKGFLSGGKWFIVSGFSIMAFILGLLLNPVIFDGDNKQVQKNVKAEIPLSQSPETNSDRITDNDRSFDFNNINDKNSKESHGAPINTKSETRQMPAADADFNSAIRQSRQSASTHFEISASALRHRGIPAFRSGEMTYYNANDEYFASHLNLKNYDKESAIEHKKSGFSIEFKGSIVNHFPEPEISPGKFSPLHNLSLAAMYKVSDDLSIGIEAEQETFSLKYRGTDEGGIKYTYYQQPNYTTFGLMIRYYPLKFGRIGPYAQMSGGINRGGYVLKPSAGIEFNAYENLSFILGLEYNRFWYFHQENWFETSKAAINYGINYKF